MLIVKQQLKAGFDVSSKSLPVSTASLFYTAENTQDAMREFYPHLNTGMSIYSWRWLSKTAIC